MRIKKRHKREEISSRKHHIVNIGDIEFMNGFGIRFDCMLCKNGYQEDGSECYICGPDEPLT